MKIEWEDTQRGFGRGERKRRAGVRMVSYYVAAMRVSQWVCLVCSLAFANWYLTGFAAIYPPMAVLGSAMAMLFWFLALIQRRRELARAAADQ